MSKKRGKRVVWCVVAGILLLNVVLFFASDNFHDTVIYYMKSYPIARYTLHDFEDYKNDFQIVTEAVLPYAATTTQTQDHNFWIEYENGICFCKYQGKRLPLSDVQNAALNNICLNVFRDIRSMTRLVVYEGRVSFNVEHNPYAIVYTADGKRPDFISYPGEEWETLTIQIKPHWFHMYTV